MPSTEAVNADDRRALLSVAARAIHQALLTGRVWTPRLADYQSPVLRDNGASFVTLRAHGDLRGCIGTLEAYRPLVLDVAANAHAAAFGDPRFAPLTQREFADLDLHISVLTTPQAMRFTSEADLLAQIRPNVDGLILEEGARRGTFLPSVWRQLPQREEFWRELKRKAGLPASYWSETLVVSGYETVEFGGAARNADRE